MENTENENSSNPMVLYVWPGEWDAASLDADCLCAMCYLKFSGLPHRIEFVKSPYLLFKNHYPQLVHHGKVYIGLEDIVDFAKSLNNIDSQLNDRNYVYMLALKDLFKAKFIPAFNDLCWIDQDFTYKVIRCAYGQYIKFPMNIVKLKAMAKNAENSIICNYRSDYVSYETLKQQILMDAKECLNIMSKKLDDGTFMLENQPTLLDAILYGYLSILFKAPFSGSLLKNHLNGCTNLCSFINRINTVYFTANENDEEKKRIAAEKKKKQQEKQANLESPSNDTSEDEWSSRDQKKRQILAIGVAASAMLLYAFTSGFIKIELTTNE